ncbi:MAG: amidohydrolase family protein, partial [Planctomycetota bacterium]
MLRRALPFVVFALSAVAQDAPVVYRGAQLWPGDGAPITDAVLVIQNGRVQNVGGQSTTIPDGARIVECAGAVITPGLIDAAWAGPV